MKKRVLNVSEARREFSRLIASGETVEVKHPKGTAVIMPKETLQKLENEIINLEMDLALAKPHKWYTSEQVHAMLAEVEEQQRKYG